MDLITASLVIVITINFVLGLLLLISGSINRTNLVYAVNVATIIGWAVSMVVFRFAAQEYIFLTTQALYISASLIASSFLYFCYIFPDNEKVPRKVLSFILLFNFAIIFLIVTDGLVIKDVIVNPHGENTITFGSVYIVYVLYILSNFLFGFYKLFRKFTASVEQLKKTQIVYLLIGYVLSANIAFATNLILPWFGYFDLNWLGQTSTILMVMFAVFAILKHNLFKVRVIATELLIFSLWIFIAIRLILADNIREFLIEGTLLAITVLVGIFLIRSVMKEVKTREKIESLVLDLKEANERLRDLDEQKSEFVSIASHQLRTPLTSIKGYASLLLDGSFGEISAEVKNPIGKIFESSQRLVGIVEDFLNVTRIEQGRMKYSFVATDMKDLIQSVVDELSFTVKQKKLSIEFTTDGQTEYLAGVDVVKIRQVIFNLVDNSIKYTTSGGIKINISKKIKDNKILITIADTGMGISEDFKDHLFKKFSRDERSKDYHANGSGIGLYIAKEIIKEHKGRIWAESKGDNKGSTFFVEFPISH
ncbi:ATP-binding protein [Patescibacteria group bacterium]